MELVDEADQDKNGKIDFGEWEFMGGFPVPVSVDTRLSNVLCSKENQAPYSNGRGPPSQGRFSRLSIRHPHSSKPR